VLFETNDKITIENIINEYFIDSNRENFNISNSIYKWNKSKTEYLYNVRLDYLKSFKL